jgi:hypothetical protein
MMSEARARAWQTAVRIVLAIAGLGAIAWLVNDVGLDPLLAVIVPALPWLPLALALEIGRIAMDAVSSHCSLGSKGGASRSARCSRHLVAFAVMGVAPAGRPTSEVVKASLLSRWLGPAPRPALATADQANTLISSGTFTLFNAIARGP